MPASFRKSTTMFGVAFLAASMFVPFPTLSGNRCAVRGSPQVLYRHAGALLEARFAQKRH
jgi:hypothetical protein